MQILITEATAAYSAAGMSDLFFIPEPMMTGTIVLDMTSRMPAELITEDLTTGISMSPARDDDDVDEEEDEDDEDDEDDLDEEDDEDDEDDLDEEDDDELDDDDEDEH